MPAGGYTDDEVIAVDVDELLRDEALTGLPDGPVKRFMTRLAVELDYDEGQPRPVLLVRRR